MAVSGRGSPEKLVVTGRDAIGPLVAVEEAEEGAGGHGAERRAAAARSGQRQLGGTDEAGKTGMNAQVAGEANEVPDGSLGVDPGGGCATSLKMTTGGSSSGCGRGGHEGRRLLRVAGARGTPLLGRSATGGLAPLLSLGGGARERTRGRG